MGHADASGSGRWIMMAVALKWLADKALGLSIGLKLGLAAVAVLAIMGMAIALYRCQAQNAEAEAQRLETALEAARLTIAARDAAIKEIEAQRATEVAALSSTLKSDNDRACRVQVMREETYHAKPEDDGPVAPVLRGALERLRPSAVGGK